MSQNYPLLDHKPRKALCAVETPAARFNLIFFTLCWLHPRRAAHSLAERGAGCHLLGEDERDLAPPTRLLAAGGNRDVSLTAVAQTMTPVCLFFYQPAEAERNKSTSQPELSKQQTVSAES